MVLVRYKKRFLIHSSFIEWLLKQHNKSKLIMCLMRIHQHSKDYKKSHNIILDSEFEKIKSLVKNVDLLKASFKVVYDEAYPFIEFQKDDVSKNVVCSIDLTSQPPYEVIILCSPEFESKFQENSHYQKIKSIKVRSNALAISLLEEQFKLFVSERQSER